MPRKGKKPARPTVIEGVAPRFVVAGIQSGTDFGNLPVNPPDKAPLDSVPVLIVPVWEGDVQAVKRKVERILERDADVDASTRAGLEDDEQRR
jgi:hypothetical protein